MASGNPVHDRESGDSPYRSTETARAWRFSATLVVLDEAVRERYGSGMDTRHKVAQRLRSLRARDGYSQEEVAKRVDAAPSTVGAWERAESEPQASDLVALAMLYNVSLEYLLGRIDYPAGLAPDQWIVDMDEVEHPAKRQPCILCGRGPGKPWCAKVPRRPQIVDYDGIRALEAQMEKSDRERKKKKRRGSAGGSTL